MVTSSHPSLAARVLLTTVALALLASTACAPIEPVAAFEASTFEGYDVVSYVPEDPVGVVHLFHGSGGSAAFAEKVESVAVLNALVERGYGFVATESTERTGDRRWDVSDPSIATNPDLARLARLHAHVVATTAASSTTPIFGVGMSNGARFVTLFGQTFADAGFSVGAVAAYMGRMAPSLIGGGLTVPTQFVLAENDTTVPNGAITFDHGELVAAGTPTELFVASEKRLSWGRFLRIAGIDAAGAQATFAALVDTGIWDEAGARVAPLDELEARAATLVLPPEVAALAPEIRDQTLVVLAVHQFRSDFAVPTVDFFDAHRVGV